MKLSNPPTTPQNLQLSVTSSEKAQITWTANSETNISGYEIERNESGSWENIGTISTSSYVDNDVNINPMFDDLISWRVRAKNTYNQYSTYSSIVSTDNGVLHKRDNKNLSEKMPQYYLINAYPNPFNPTTKISFQIPETGYVSLKVYNSLGKEVADLVNEMKTEGKYTEIFDASNLSSGVYYYRIQVKDFIKTNKMLFLK